MGIWITIIGVLLGIIGTQIVNFTDNYSSNIILLIRVILIIIIPGISDFLGIIWLDFSMRITKNAFFTYRIEKKIHTLYKNDDLYLLEWEHFKKNDSESESPIKYINFFYYFVMIGCFFFVVPIVCFYLYHTLLPCCGISIQILIILFVIEIVTFIFAYIYIYKILDLNNFDD